MDPMDMEAFLFAMPMSANWSITEFVLLFFMWLVMMIAMMTASVAPLILTFAMVQRLKKKQESPFIPAGYLFSGYFVIWAFFSLAATLLQWALQKIGWLNPGMKITYKILGALILIAAGAFQFTPLKQQCLRHCRTPTNFILKKWKEGKSGAFKMGIDNGLYCLGCCWVLMVVLFVAGIMNVLWIAVITLFVLIEKIAKHGKLVSYTAGAGLIVYGIITLLSRHN